MDEKQTMKNVEIWKWVLYVIKSYLNHDVWFVYLVEALITFKLEKNSLNSWVPLVQIHLFFLNKLLFVLGVDFHSDPRTCIRFPMKSHFIILLYFSLREVSYVDEFESYWQLAGMTLWNL